MKAPISRQTVGRSAIWSIIEGGASQLLGLCVFLVTAHYVAPAAFGVLATALLLINLFREVVLEGLVAAVNRRADPTAQDYNACFFLVVILSTILAGATYLLTSEIARFVPISRLSDAIPPVCILLLTFGLSRTHEAYLSRHFQFRSLALRSLVSIVIGGSVGIIMAVNGFGLWSLITQQLITALVALVILWNSCPWRPRFDFDKKTVWQILGFAQHVSFTGVMNFANNQADIAFSSIYLGPAQTGQYNAAKRVGSSINLLVANSLNRVVMPTMAKVQDDVQRARRVFLQAISLTTTLTAPVFAGIACLAPDIIHVAMGDRWHEAAAILRLIAPTYFLITVQQYHQSILFVAGKPQWQTMLTALSAVLNIILFLIFVHHGVLAVATAYTARAIIISPVSIAVAVSVAQVRWREYATAFLPATTAAIIMAAFVGFARNEVTSLSVIARLALLVPLGAGIYIAALWILRAQHIKDLLGLAREAAGRGS